MAETAIPEGFHTATPYLVVPQVERQIEFLKRSFDATELFRVPRPDGSIMHAEVKIGDSVVMMGEPMSGQKPIPAAIYLYVEDADDIYRRALKAGAISTKEPADEFYGDRCAGVQDHAGNHWWIATRKEEVGPDELARRVKAMAGG